MILNPDQCCQAVLTRDARFDGRFFVAVKSPRIYCRPICRVKTPMRKNCSFYGHAVCAMVLEWVKRLFDWHTDPAAINAALGYLFPTPARMARATVDEIGRLGIIGKRAETIIALAKAISGGVVHLWAGLEKKT